MMTSAVKRKEYYERLGLEEGASTGKLSTETYYFRFPCTISIQGLQGSFFSFREYLDCNPK